MVDPVTGVYPLSRQAVVSDQAIPIWLHISFQKFPRHRVSLSEITCLGIPNFEMIWWKNNSVVSFSPIVVVVGINTAYFVSLSTITKILLNPSDKGSSGIKSMDTTSKGWVGLGIGCTNPKGPWC